MERTIPREGGRCVSLPCRCARLACRGIVVLIVAAIVVFSGGSSPPSHSPHAHASGHTGSSGSGDASQASVTGFFVTSSSPAAGAQDVASNTPISVTFSEPVALSKVTPQLSPAFGGKWVRSGQDTLTYQLNSPLVPSSHVVVTIPGGSSGLRACERRQAVGVDDGLLRRRGRETSSGFSSCWPGSTSCR